MGMIASRCSFEVAFSEIASFGRTFSSASFSMPGIIPLVESVVCFGVIAMPFGSSKILSAAVTAS